MQVAGVDGGARGVEAGGACPRSVNACTSCCRISPESVGLVLDMGADTGVEWLHSSVGCISMALTSCGMYWNGLGGGPGRPGWGPKELSRLEFGLVEGLLVGSPVTVAYRLLEMVSESSRRQMETVRPAQWVQSEDGNGL